MAFLTFLEIESEHTETSPAGKSFRVTYHHVKEQVLYFLPAKFMLDGSAKFQITVCRGAVGFESRTVLGSTECRVGNFDFERYFALAPREQEEAVTALILSTLAAYTGPDSVAFRTIEAACRKAQESGFHLRYEVDKLRRSLPHQKKLRVRVFRKLSYEVGECWEAQLEKGTETAGCDVMRSSTHVDLTSYYKSARIEGEVYSIRDCFDKTVYSWDLKATL